MNFAFILKFFCLFFAHLKKVSNFDRVECGRFR